MNQREASKAVAKFSQSQHFADVSDTIRSNREIVKRLAL